VSPEIHIHTHTHTHTHTKVWELGWWCHYSGGWAFCWICVRAFSLWLWQQVYLFSKQSRHGSRIQTSACAVGAWSSFTGGNMSVVLWSWPPTRTNHWQIQCFCSIM